jgi:hypothetical protein
MHGDGVEAIVDRDIARQSEIDALLRLIAITEPQPVMAVPIRPRCRYGAASIATTPSP